MKILNEQEFKDGIMILRMCADYFVADGNYLDPNLIDDMVNTYNVIVEEKRVLSSIIPTQT